MNHKTDTTPTLSDNRWGRWGADDERGALNFIGPDEVRRATALVRSGYSGDVDIELMGEDLENPEYAELISHSKRVASELLDACG